MRLTKIVGDRDRMIVERQDDIDTLKRTASDAEIRYRLQVRENAELHADLQSDGRRSRQDRLEAELRQKSYHAPGCYSAISIVLRSRSAARIAVTSRQEYKR